MIRVLITGMSGTGKSAVLAELRRRGHSIIDTDEGRWSHEVDAEDGSGRETLWHEDRMAARLASPATDGDDHDADGVLFVGGCVRNQGRFYDRFDAVVLLSASAEVMLERIKVRTTNPFGKAATERERILRDLADVEPLLRAGADVEIDTRRAVSEVADLVEAAAYGPPIRGPA